MSKGYKRQTKSQRICIAAKLRELHREKKPRKQKIAIALKYCGVKKKKK